MKVVTKLNTLPFINFMPQNQSLAVSCDCLQDLLRRTVAVDIHLVERHDDPLIRVRLKNYERILVERNNALLFNIIN